MSLKPEVFWLGKPKVSYFQDATELKQAFDSTSKLGWKLANREQLNEAWKQGANWCAAGATAITDKGDQYMSLYPISEEASRISGGCGNTLGVQVFGANPDGTAKIIYYPELAGGINIYGVKPNPDFPETIPPGITAKWQDAAKEQVIIDINGVEYMVASFNKIKGQYHSPATDPYPFNIWLLVLLIVAFILLVLIIIWALRSKKSTNPQYQQSIRA